MIDSRKLIIFGHIQGIAMVVIVWNSFLMFCEQAQVFGMERKIGHELEIINVFLINIPLILLTFGTRVWLLRTTKIQPIIRLLPIFVMALLAGGIPFSITPVSVWLSGIALFLTIFEGAVVMVKISESTQ